MKRKGMMIVTIFAIISFACVSLGTSYAFISKLSSNTVNQNIKTGNLNATLSYTTLTNAEIVPLTDEEGINQTTYAKLSVSKNNQYTVFYSINFSYSVKSIPSGSAKEDLVPLEFVRIAVFDSESSTTPIVGPVSITELPLSSVDTSDHYNDVYLLSYANFAASSDSKTYYIKAWLDPNTPDEFDEKLIYLDASINQEPLIAKSLYNLSGTVKNGSSAVSGAVISIQNNDMKNKSTVTTASDGTFSLSSVPNGTYNLIVTYSGNTYETTIHVQNGDTSLVSTRSATTCAAGSYLQACAYTNYTTVSKIINYSSYVGYSNSALTSSVNVPPSYVVQGLDSISVQNITGINVTLNADKTLTLSK